MPKIASNRDCIRDISIGRLFGNQAAPCSLVCPAWTAQDLGGSGCPFPGPMQPEEEVLDQESPRGVSGHVPASGVGSVCGRLSWDSQNPLEGGAGMPRVQITEQ